MIVVAILGLLAAIAYPGYASYVTKARRSDVQGALLGFASAMEGHHTTNNSYRGAADGGGDTGPPAIYAKEAPVSGSTKYYDLTIVAPVTASAYTLRATPKGAQAGDGFLELTSTGIRSWDKDDNGAIDASEQSWGP